MNSSGDNPMHDRHRNRIVESDDAVMDEQASNRGMEVQLELARARFRSALRNKASMRSAIKTLGFSPDPEGAAEVDRAVNALVQEEGWVDDESHEATDQSESEHSADEALDSQ